MQDNNFASFNLDQSIIHELSDSRAVRLSAQNKTMNISKKWCRIEHVYGKLELVAAPHFCLTLSNPSDGRKRPLTLVDSSNNINLWISAVGKNVKIRDVFVISEHFQMQSNDPIQYLSLMVRWENLSVIDSNLPQSRKRPAPHDFDESHLSQPDTVAKELHPQSKLFRIYVHHVSTPFYVDGRNSIAYCLVLISYFNQARVESKLWLVLTKEQVAWREFILPNREYRIRFPPNIDTNYFDEHLRPLEKWFPPGNKSLKEILHHPDLFLTLYASTLPQNSKLYLSSKMNVAMKILAFFNDSMSLWYSVAEAARAEVDLVSMYGQIDELLYTDDSTFRPGSCQLCNRGRWKEPSLKKPHRKEDHPWVNPWQTKSLEDFPLLELPIVKDDMSTMETGVPGNMVQVVKMRDTVTGDQVSVYMKHSVLRSSQQVCQLLPGLVVCVSHLNRRVASSGRYYYIPTVLSNLRILALPEATSGSETSENWGRYGLWHQSPSSVEKMWGVLESFHLSKIVISAKCKNCESLFYKAICSARCPNPRTYLSSAHAMAKVQVISDKGSISLEKVLIKNDCVRKLLGMPEDIWAAALVAASMDEIVVINGTAALGENSPNGLSGLFKIYCTVCQLPNKMYVCLRKLESRDGEDSLYYCIDLEPITSYRLRKVAQIAKQASNN